MSQSQRCPGGSPPRVFSTHIEHKSKQKMRLLSEYYEKKNDTYSGKKIRFEVNKKKNETLKAKEKIQDFGHLRIRINEENRQFSRLLFPTILGS